MGFPQLFDRSFATRISFDDARALFGLGIFLALLHVVWTAAGFVITGELGPSSAIKNIDLATYFVNLLLVLMPALIQAVAALLLLRVVINILVSTGSNVGGGNRG